MPQSFLCGIGCGDVFTFGDHTLVHSGFVVTGQIQLFGFEGEQFNTVLLSGVPNVFIMAAASSPSRPEMTSFWVVLLMIFFVELYTMVSRRLSALEMEEFRSGQISEDH